MHGKHFLTLLQLRLGFYSAVGSLLARQGGVSVFIEMEVISELKDPLLS